MSYGIINIIKNTGYYFFIEINKYFKIMQNKEDLNKLSFRDKLKDFSFTTLISLYLTLLIPPIGIFFVIVLPIFTLFQMKKIRKDSEGFKYSIDETDEDRKNSRRNYLEEKEYSKKEQFVIKVIVFSFVIFSILINFYFRYSMEGYIINATLFLLWALFFAYYKRGLARKYAKILEEKGLNKIYIPEYGKNEKIFIFGFFSFSLGLSLFLFYYFNDLRFVSFILLIFTVFLYLLDAGKRRRIFIEGERNEFLAIKEKFGLDFKEKEDVLSIHDKFRLIGDELKMTNVISGALSGFFVRIFDLNFKWMKNASYGATFLELSLPRDVPDMLIISKKGEFAGVIDAKKFFAGRSIELEGDFRDHFNVYVEEEGEPEVRRILSPDLMVLLIDELSDFSFLFFGNRLYIFLNSSSGLLGEKYYMKQIGRANLVLSKWSRILERF